MAYPVAKSDSQDRILEKPYAPASTEFFEPQDGILKQLLSQLIVLMILTIKAIVTVINGRIILEPKVGERKPIL